MGSAKRPPTGGAGRPMLSTREVAERLGISYRKVTDLALRGLLKRIIVTPRCVRYEQSDVERFIRESTETRQVG